MILRCSAVILVAPPAPTGILFRRPRGVTASGNYYWDDHDDSYTSPPFIIVMPDVDLTPIGAALTTMRFTTTFYY